MADPETHDIDGVSWQVKPNTVAENGETWKGVLFWNVAEKEFYLLTPLISPKETGEMVVNAKIAPVVKKGASGMIGENVPASQFSPALRDILADRMASYLEDTRFTASEGLIAAIKSGDAVLRDTSYSQTITETDIAIRNILSGHSGQSEAAKRAGKMENLIVRDLPADYHEQIDKALDEGGPEAAKAYAAQFKKPEGGHVAKQDARRDEPEERSR